jgi:alpha-beta hydrolase superfamily lysophospholipase
MIAMGLELTRLSIAAGLIFTLNTSWLSASPAAKADVLHTDNGQLTSSLKTPIHEWGDPQVAPKGIVIAVHGLMKHGGVFDTLGRRLVASGYSVVAPDLRGYGHWCTDGRPKCDRRISYKKSYEDLVSLTEHLHKKHPNLPIFLVGESLGADLTIHLAAEHPELVRGLVLSAPAIRHFHSVLPIMISDMMLVAAKPNRQIDMRPFITTFTSNDPRVINESLKDPLSRKTLSFGDLLQSRKMMKSTLKYADHVPATIPVLIVHGSGDRLIKSSSVIVLMMHLHSTDQTVKWYDQKGHILLETAFAPEATLEAIDSWLHSHMPNKTIFQALLPQESPTKND